MRAVHRDFYRNRFHSPSKEGNLRSARGGAEGKREEKSVKFPNFNI